MGAAIIMFIVGAGAVMGGYYAFTTLPGLMRQRKLQSRLTELNAAPVDLNEKGGPTLVKVREEGPLPILDRYIGGTARGSELAKWIEQTGTKVTVSSLCLMSLGIAALFGLIGWVMSQNARQCPAT